MLNRPKVTFLKDTESVHISLGEMTISTPISSGFSFNKDKSEISINSCNYPCSEKNYRQLTKAFHKAIAPKKSSHKIWALSVFGIFFWLGFVVLTLGTPGALPTNAGQASFNAPPIASMENAAPNSGNNGNSEFPFANR